MKNQGLVLRVDPYRSKSSIVTLMSDEHGVIKGFFRMPSTAQWQKSPSFGSLLKFESLGRDLKKEILSVSHFEVLQDLLSDRFNDPKFYQHWVYCQLWAEILSRTNLEEEAYSLWFEKTKNLFSAVYDLQTTGLLAMLLTDYLAEIGYPFDWQICQGCQKPVYMLQNGQFKWRAVEHYLAVAEQGLLCRYCSQSQYLLHHQPIETSTIKLWHQISYSKSPMELSFERAYPYLATLVELVEGYFRLKLKSWAFFEQFFPSKLTSEELTPEYSLNTAKDEVAPSFVRPKHK